MAFVRWLLAACLMLFWWPVLVVGARVGAIARLHPFARLAFRLTLRVLGMDLRVRGLAHVDVSRPTLFLGNHVSLFDAFAFVAAVPQRVVAVEEAANFRFPIYGPLVAAWGNIPLDRTDAASALASLDGVVAALHAGRSVCMMPEGTRTRDGEVGAFRLGPFRVAIEAGATIVPFALVGMRAFNRPGTWVVRPALVEVVFLPAIDASLYAREDLGALAEQVRADLLGALKPGSAGV